MRSLEFILNEGQIDQLTSDIADLVTARKGQKVQKMDFDEFYSDLKDRGHKELSPKLLRDILDTLVTDTNIFHNVTADTIEFANDDLPDDMDQDSIEDMGAKVSSMADQEAMKGIKAEL